MNEIEFYWELHNTKHKEKTIITMHTSAGWQQSQGFYQCVHTE